MMVKKPPITRRWILCPYCGMKTILADDNANCHGVHIKCTRGCKQVFELVIRDGVQINNTSEPKN